jgi:N6-adenosine-specific RNA methylase IME4
MSDAKARQESKRRSREARERNLATAIRALPGERYGVIYADPPWRFEPRSRITGMDRAADNHYPTMTTAAIEALDVGSLAAPDCALFLWATAPMLVNALDVMATWGFGYRTHMVWDKVKLGTGYWFRGRHELLLLGARGQPPAPAPGTQAQSLLSIARSKHSAKPDQFAGLIENYYPTVPKIELFRRGPPRKGWSSWGAETTEAAE